MSRGAEAADVVADALRGVAPDVADAVRAFLSECAPEGRATAPGPLPRPGERAAGLAWVDRGRCFVAPGRGRPRPDDVLVHREPRALLEAALDRWIRDRLIDLDAAALPDPGWLRDVRAAGRRVVAALAGAEEAARDAWLAPRAVSGVDWFVTIDRAPLSCVAAAIASAPQRAAWRRLHGREVSADAAPASLVETAPWLMVESRHLPAAATAALVDGLGDLEDGLDGWLFAADNRPALRLLRGAFAGRVRCVVTDPPYNTGLGAFAYEDGYRRSSWLSMMAETSELLAALLAPDGASFVLCDDNEQPRLRLLLDEVYGEANFVGTIVWKKVSARKNKALVSVSHDYLVVHAADVRQWSRNLLPRTAAQTRDYTNRDDDPRGPWRSVSFSVKSEDGDRRAAWRYPIETPAGVVFDPPTGRHWNGLPARFEELRRDGRIWFGPDGARRPRVKVFLSEVQGGIVPDTWWDHDVAGSNQEAKKQLLELVSDLIEGEPFQTPKPVRLFERVLAIATRPTGRDVVLDPFGGSGTAAHAVIARNRYDGGDRRYVVAESGPHLDSVVIPRLQRLVRASRWRVEDGAARPVSADPIPHAFACVRLAPPGPEAAGAPPERAPPDTGRDPSGDDRPGVRAVSRFLHRR